MSRYLTTDQMCRIFDVCSKSIHAWAKRKGNFVRPVKVFRSLLWPADEVADWIRRDRDRAVGNWDRLSVIREERNEYGRYKFDLDAGCLESDRPE